MTAGDGETEHRNGGARIGSLRIQKNRVQMGFRVVDGDQWTIQTNCQSLGNRPTHEERAGETGAACGGYGVNVAPVYPRAFHRFFNDAGQKLDVAA